MVCLTCGRESDASATYCRFCGSKLIDWRTNKHRGADQVSPAVRLPHFAGFWRRVLAFLVDEFLLGIVTFVFSASYLVSILSGPDVKALEITAMSNRIFSLLLHWLYFTIMESCPTQATLGKMAIGIIVTGYDGGRISFLRANGRYFGKFLSALIFGIGFIMAGITQKKQALHDMLARTLVVMK